MFALAFMNSHGGARGRGRAAGQWTNHCCECFSMEKCVFLPLEIYFFSQTVAGLLLPLPLHLTLELIPLQCKIVHCSFKLNVFHGKTINAHSQNPNSGYMPAHGACPARACMVVEAGLHQATQCARATKYNNMHALLLVYYPQNKYTSTGWVFAEYSLFVCNFSIFSQSYTTLHYSRNCNGRSWSLT